MSFTLNYTHNNNNFSQDFETLVEATKELERVGGDAYVMFHTSSEWTFNYKIQTNDVVYSIGKTSDYKSGKFGTLGHLNRIILTQGIS